MMARRHKLQTREGFFSYVAAPENLTLDICHEWRGPLQHQTERGRKRVYGQFKYEGRIYQAHRLAAYFAGVIPDPDYPTTIKRSCKNSLCCNPKHFKVT